MRQLALALLAAAAIFHPSPRVTARQNLRGAYERALDRMWWWNLGSNLERENYGARGRTNDLRDQCRTAEVPRNFQPGYLGSF
jgi:hypothetical protein